MLTYPPEAMRAYCRRSRYWLREMIAQGKADIRQLEQQGQGRQAEPLREMVRELEEIKRDRISLSGHSRRMG